MAVMGSVAEGVFAHGLTLFIHHADIMAAHGAAPMIDDVLAVPRPAGMHLKARSILRRQFGELSGGNSQRPDAIGPAIAATPEARRKIAVNQQQVGVGGTVRAVGAAASIFAVDGFD